MQPSLASKFRRKQINSLFLGSLLDFANELKPDLVVICSNAPLEMEKLEELNSRHQTFLVVSDANRCLELLQANQTVHHYTRRKELQDDVIRDILMHLLSAKKITESSNLLFLYGRNDWDYFSQILMLEVSTLRNLSWLRSLAELEHIAPLEILETVLEMALELGAEGREGKPVGTILVLGDHRNVLKNTRSLVLNPFKGYSRSQRDIMAIETRDSIKEIAKIDGAIIISSSGIVQAGGQYLDFRAADVDLSPGLGSRHAAAAAASKGTESVAFAISESTGIVRVFAAGKLFLQINPRQHSLLRI